VVGGTWVGLRGCCVVGRVVFVFKMAAYEFGTEAVLESSLIHRDGVSATHYSIVQGTEGHGSAR
jgi:hypothetical protein